MIALYWILSHMIEATWKQKFLYLFPHKNQGLSTPRAFYFYCSTSQHHVDFNPSSTLVGSTSKYSIRSRVQHRVLFLWISVNCSIFKNFPKIKLFSIIYTSRTSAKSPYLWKMQKNELKWPCETFSKWVKDPNSKKYGAYLSCTSVIYIIINILVMKTSGPHGLARKLGNSCF